MTLMSWRLVLEDGIFVDFIIGDCYFRKLVVWELDHLIKMQKLNINSELFKLFEMLGFSCLSHEL